MPLLMQRPKMMEGIVMTQKQFEAMFSMNKQSYKSQIADLQAQMIAARKSYHERNIEIEKMRSEMIQSDPKKCRKSECYKLQHCLGGYVKEWTGKHLDTTNATVHFNCCSDDAAVFTLTVPYRV